VTSEAAEATTAAAAKTVVLQQQQQHFQMYRDSKEKGKNLMLTRLL
jgi:hypothetical protein